MPRASANCVCDNPDFCLAWATSLGSTFVTRAVCPAFISRTDFSSFRPRSSPAEGFEVRLTIFNLLTYCLEQMTRNVVSNGLGVYKQEPDFSGRQPREVDDSYPAALARAGARPAHLSAATTTGNHIAG